MDDGEPTGTTNTVYGPVRGNLIQAGTIGAVTTGVGPPSYTWWIGEAWTGSRR
jgi:hypothetical protein